MFSPFSGLDYNDSVKDVIPLIDLFDTEDAFNETLPMSIYINRVLNMKHIKAIGFDMDYTLVRYNLDAFEGEAFEAMKKKLIQKGYPQKVKQLKFDPSLAIRGLVIDKSLGNILKLSLHSRVKSAYHGTKPIDFKEQQKIYRGLLIDLNDSERFAILDTSFSIAYAIMYMHLVDLKDQGESGIPDYHNLERDCLEVIDLAHRDGSLKDKVRGDVKKYIVQDPNSVAILERFKKAGKKLWVITNSDYQYTKLLLDYAINPFLKEYQSWNDLFDITITSSSKPRFFTEKLNFLKVDLETGLLKNHFGAIENGVYQGGCAIPLQEEFGLSGEEILYLGDHIYGDILSLKKTCNWRTALVVEEIDKEVSAFQKSLPYIKQMDELMEQKTTHETKLDQLYEKSANKEKIQEVYKKIELIDQELSKLIKNCHQLYNPYWGEIFRSGVEASRFAGQVEKYACIYMGKISDLNHFSPRTYFRPKRRPLPHENGLM